MGYEVGRKGNKLGSLKLRFPGKTMTGIAISSHPMRRGLGDRLTSGGRFVREYESQNQTPAWPGKVVRDWNLFRKMNDQDPAVAGIMLLDALQDFMAAPRDISNSLRAAGVRELTTKSDFPAEVLSTIEKYHTGLEEIDTTYQEVFDIIDFTGTKEDGFKIRDVTSGLTFRKIPAGDTVDVYSMSGTEVDVGFDNYGGALGWEKTWFDDEKFWTVDDTAIEFRKKWYQDVAEIYVALIEAVAGQDQAWAAHPDGVASGVVGYQVGRDIQTINNATTNILEDLKAAGMAVSPSEMFILWAPATLRSRMNRALAANYELKNTGMGALEVAGNVTPRYTTLMSSNDYYYVILPKRKLKGGNRMDLTVLTDTDILAYTEVAAGWGRHGGGIGEDNQIRKCSIA